MSTLVCPSSQKTALPLMNTQVDAFTQSFNIVNSTLSFPIRQEAGSGRDFWNGLETLTKMAGFAAKNHTGNPAHLWESVKPLIEQLQEILEDPRSPDAFSKRDRARLSKCYHELTEAACVFSLAGDSALNELLIGEVGDACNG